MRWATRTLGPCHKTHTDPVILWAEVTSVSKHTDLLSKLLDMHVTQMWKRHGDNALGSSTDDSLLCKRSTDG